MPELPEVETTLLGIRPHLQGQTITAITVRQAKLRWPVPQDIDVRFQGSRIEKIWRRGKYLLLQTASGTLLIHLGMSGRLSLVSISMPPLKHDHIDVLLQNQRVLRYTDSRRFGTFLWIDNEKVTEHSLLNRLGVEPLEDAFSTEYLWQ